MKPRTGRILTFAVKPDQRRQVVATAPPCSGGLRISARVHVERSGWELRSIGATRDGCELTQVCRSEREVFDGRRGVEEKDDRERREGMEAVNVNDVSLSRIVTALQGIERQLIQLNQTLSTLVQTAGQAAPPPRNP
jgi:hypothetical protein